MCDACAHPACLLLACLIASAVSTTAVQTPDAGPGLSLCFDILHVVVPVHCHLSSVCWDPAAYCVTQGPLHKWSGQYVRACLRPTDSTCPQPAQARVSQAIAHPALSAMYTKRAQMEGLPWQYDSIAVVWCINAYQQVSNGHQHAPELLAPVLQIRQRNDIHAESKLEILCADADMYVARIGNQ